MSDKLLKLLEQFTGQTVLVVGDLMLDRYWWGTVARTSPEAPVPVVQKRRTTVAAGGAANVAANVAALGGRAVLVGLIGKDETGAELARVLQTGGVAPHYLVQTEERPTTTKLRIVAHNQHVVRIDEEETAPASDWEATAILERVRSLMPEVGALVLSDYAKGALGPRVLGALVESGRLHRVPVLVDPKGQDYRRYEGATLLAPNRLEALIAANIPAETAHAVDAAGRYLLEHIRIETLLITEGEAGMTLFERDRPPIRLPARARVVYDVTGAGDSVMAVLGLSLAVGADLISAGQLANLAGGLAVEQVRTATVSADQLQFVLKAAPDEEV